MQSSHAGLQHSQFIIFCRVAAELKAAALPPCYPLLAQFGLLCRLNFVCLFRQQFVLDMATFGDLFFPKDDNLGE